ncbi:MAG: protein translocase subunit SecD [Tyzzerella sp.]|nr:protein translocase subunit SecD [Tyzzerella sp.]
MKKSRGILSLILMVALIALLGFTCVVGFGNYGMGAAKNIKLGLDLAGGVSITYQAKDENPTAEQMADTIYKLQKRVEQYSTEATVYQEGTDRINIEIPGVSDANKILEELGKPGSLQFKDESGNVVLEGTDVKSASAQTMTDEYGGKQYGVELNLTAEGTKKFAEATQANVGKTISIVYDNEEISNPGVREAITGGQAWIDGMASYEEANTLASTIRIGGLQLELEELRSNVVGAQLGEEAISTSLLAGAIGLAIVFLFMCVVYLLPGFASSIALIIYTGIVLVLLNAFEITLTLPGIAGIILSIGMAVDANVIIFARVKEEMASGKSVKSSLKAGFAKALSAIVDGNITTLIAAIVLGIMGSGSVKGFAYTLALGIVVSMFTALVITRIIIYAFYAIGLRSPKLYGTQKERKTRDFLSRKMVSFAISGIIVLVGVAFMGMNAAKGNGAFQYGLDFKGGTASTVTFDKDYSIKEIDELIIPVVEKVTGDANVQAQKVQGSNAVIIKTKSLGLEEREAFNQAMADEFQVDAATITAENISSTISAEMRNDAIIALLIATVCMLIYIRIRFKDIRFATSAVLALLHDVLIVLAFYAISRISIGNTFIACILTIVGYSINATIVIFDRIREALEEKKKNEELSTLVNKSITDTLTRSIYTNVTTFIMIAVLYVLGVNSIREFAMPLMVGVIGGTFSSICITGPLWYVMKTKFVKK